MGSIKLYQISLDDYNNLIKSGIDIRKYYYLTELGTIKLSVTEHDTIPFDPTVFDIITSGIIIHPSFSDYSVSNVTDTTATVGAKMYVKGVLTTYSVEYGTTTGYGLTQVGSTTITDGYISFNLSNLIPETTYNWRIKTINQYGTLYSDNNTLGTTVNQNWIMITHFWSDSKIWIDTAIWYD
jgi:hypothetical protein